MGIFLVAKELGAVEGWRRKMKKEEEEKKEEGEEEEETNFFEKKNPTKGLSVLRIPLWELSLQKKIEGC